MSFGGHVSGMISSLKNNSAMLNRLKERRDYAMAHHAEKKIKEKLQDKEYDPKMIAKLKEEAIQEYKAEKLRHRLIVLFVLSISGFVFVWVLSLFKVI